MCRSTRPVDPASASDHRQNVAAHDRRAAIATRAAQRYFSDLIAHLGAPLDLHCVAIAHMVPNSIPFLQALAKLAIVDLVLAKPKSFDHPERRIIQDTLGIPVERLTRELTADPARTAELLTRAGAGDHALALLDIGGYYAGSADAINAALNGTLVGIMEGTENGAQRYDRNPPATVPVITVARSPLKLPEDYLVGASVVFSIEAVLREQSEILQTRKALVIGYGRVGSGVADTLRGRGIPTSVYDTDPIATANAAARGYEIFRELPAALRRNTLIVCATGQRALSAVHFPLLCPDTVVASVTSSDDEFDLSEITASYQRYEHSAHIVEYVSEADHKVFWLINDGNAANFLHNAVIGPAIQLIEGEKLAAVATLASTPPAPGQLPLAEVGTALRREVATIWSNHFA